MKLLRSSHTRITCTQGRAEATAANPVDKCLVLSTAALEWRESSQLRFRVAHERHSWKRDHSICSSTSNINGSRQPKLGLACTQCWDWECKKGRKINSPHIKSRFAHPPTLFGEYVYVVYAKLLARVHARTSVMKCFVLPQASAVCQKRAAPFSFHCHFLFLDMNTLTVCLGLYLYCFSLSGR